MKTLHAIISSILVVLAFGSCELDNDCISGNGNLVSRDFTIADFNKLAVHGSADVYISKGTTTNLSIEGESNVLDELDIEVNNDVLSIGEDNCFNNSEKLKIYLTTNDLQGIYVAGSCDIYSPDQFTSETFTVEIEGLSDIEVNMVSEEFIAIIAGSGNITAEGSADHQSINIDGSGDVNCFDLLGSSASIDIDGSGDIQVNVSETLEVNISGIGNVYYKGNPSITQDISGSGKIENAD